MIYGKPIWEYNCRKENGILSINFNFDREIDREVIQQLQFIIDKKRSNKLLKLVLPFLSAFGVNWNSNEEIQIIIPSLTDIQDNITVIIAVPIRRFEVERDKEIWGKISLSNILMGQ